MPRTALLLPALLVPALLAGCSDGGVTVAVTATKSSCEVADTSLEAGTYSFEVKNATDSELELYVYGESGGEFTKVVAEAEHIAPGTSRKAKAKLTAGEYELACKSDEGEGGNRTKVTVTG